MKKKILIFLTALLLLVCFVACNNTPSTSVPQDSSQIEESATPPQSETPSGPSQSEEPVFPNNDFGKDNEVTYPNAWN